MYKDAAKEENLDGDTKLFCVRLSNLILSNTVFWHTALENDVFEYFGWFLYWVVLAVFSRFSSWNFDDNLKFTGVGTCVIICYHMFT